jgi:Zn-dependent protease
MEYRMWFWGVFFAVILCFASNGWLYMIPIGGFLISMIPGHRLGYFRYDINYFSVGIIALIGPLANICLALFFKLFMFLPNPLIYQAMRINVLIAFFSMLPFPPLDGSKVLFAARPLYAFGFFGISATGLLLMFMKSVPMAIILGLIFAVLGWAFYFFSYEFK